MANLACLPEEVIIYSEGLLKKLEDNKNNKENFKDIIENSQMELFDFTEVKEKRKKNDIMEKFQIITGPILGEEGSKKVCERVLEIENIDDISILFNYLAPIQDEG